MKTNCLERYASRIVPWAFGLFVALTLVLLFAHEPWSDEAQAWLLARDVSIRDLLFVYAGYEGSPVLWHLLFMPFAKLGFPYVTMHLMSAAITVATAWIVVRFAPFSSFHKLLFLFGYFSLFEYNALSRSYTLSVFFLCLVAHGFGRRFSQPVRYLLPLALLMQTNVHSVVIALPMYAFVVYEFWKRRTTLTSSHLFGCAMVLASALVAVVCLWPPPDLMEILSAWNFDVDERKFSVFGGVFAYAFFPLPSFAPYAWSTMNTLPFWPWIAPLSLLGFMLPFVFFWERPTLFTQYLCSFGILLCVFIFKTPPYLRHIGLVYFLFLIFVWMSRAVEFPHFSQLFIRWQSILLTLILCTHVFAALPIFVYEVQQDFSASREAAIFIQQQGWSSRDTLLAGYPSFTVAALLPYLPDEFPTLYAVDADRQASYAVWNTQTYDHALTLADVQTRVEAVASRNPDKRIIFIVGDSFREGVYITDSYLFLARFTAGLKPEDSYTLYEYTPTL